MLGFMEFPIGNNQTKTENGIIPLSRVEYYCVRYKSKSSYIWWQIYEGIFVNIWNISTHFPSYYIITVNI